MAMLMLAGGGDRKGAAGIISPMARSGYTSTGWIMAPGQWGVAVGGCVGHDPRSGRLGWSVARTRLAKYIDFKS